MRHGIMMLCAALALVGCGGGLDALYGTYDGEVELRNATNLGQRTNTQDALVTLTSEPDGSLLLGITSKCSVSVTLDEASGALTIAAQTCMWDGQRTTDTWTYQGAGNVGEGTLTLDLEGDFTRTYQDGSPPLTGVHNFDFSGARL